MTFIERPARDEVDYGHMRALLQEIAARTGPPLYCSIGDLDWWRFTAEDPAYLCRARLWWNDDSFAGFAWPENDNSVEFLVHPDHAELLTQMLDWAESRIVTRPDPPSPRTLEAWAYDSDASRIATFQQRGYVRQPLALRFHARDLATALPPPRLPAGYAIGDLQGATAETIAARVAVHRAAFAPSRMTIAKHNAVMAAPTYRPDLDLVAIAPDGTSAAFCIVWLDRANRFGVFEPVGTHPAHQRRGLARALLTEGCRRLAALGARQAFVDSWSDNDAASRLYPAAGFTLVDSNHQWRKTVQS